MNDLRSIKVVIRKRRGVLKPHLRFFVKRKALFRVVTTEASVEWQINLLRRELEANGGKPAPRKKKAPPKTQPEPTADQLETLLERWQADLHTVVKPQQAIAATQCVRRILGAAGISDVSEMTIGRARVAIAGLRCVPRKSQGEPPLLSEQSRKHYSRFLKQFFKWLVRERYIATNPLSDWKLSVVKTERNPRDRLQPQELEALISTTMRSRFKTGGYDGETRAWLYALGATTGLRRGELAALTSKSFDWTTNTLSVPRSYTKNGTMAVLPIHGGLAAELHVWARERPGELFPALRQKCVARMIRLDLKRAGIAYKSADGSRCFHSLRNSFISALFDLGASLATAQRLARHSDPRLTMKYSKPKAGENAIVDQIPCMVPRMVPGSP
ncbi:MAG: tyrosine-type recombinase/integrase [Pirellulaceae bacterium]